MKLPCFLVSYKLFGKFLHRTKFFRSQFAMKGMYVFSSRDERPLCICECKYAYAKAVGIKDNCHDTHFLICILWDLSGTKPRNFCGPSTLKVMAGGFL